MWALVINGKIQTEKVDEFVEKFNKLIDETNSEFFGKIDRYHVVEYVEYQKISEPITVNPDVEI